MFYLCCMYDGEIDANPTYFMWHTERAAQGKTVGDTDE